MQETNECLSQPCYNGATCIDRHINFTCDCPSSWKGRTCQEDVDECENSPCLNGGTCINLKGSFECECIESFCGQTCTLTNPCLDVSIIYIYRFSLARLVPSIYVMCLRNLNALIPFTDGICYMAFFGILYYLEGRYSCVILLK